jgi:hypothetical protein
MILKNGRIYITNYINFIFGNSLGRSLIPIYTVCINRPTATIPTSARGAFCEQFFWVEETKESKAT